MPAWRRRAKCIGTFAQATREQDEEVPPPSDASTSPERSAIERHNGGWGIALYCGYLRAGCGNDCSERRRRCSLCKDTPGASHEIGCGSYPLDLPCHGSRSGKTTETPNMSACGVVVGGADAKKIAIRPDHPSRSWPRYYVLARSNRPHH